MTTLSRRHLLYGALAASVPHLPGQPPKSPPPQLPHTPYRNYARCLPDYLRALAVQSRQVRLNALQALTSASAIKQRQEWVRGTFWQITGGRPAVTPLNARTMRSVELADLRIECLVFESQPGLHVAANLYIPLRGAAPFPAVLFQPGHAPSGKAYPVYQLCCQGLARLGFVVLSIDPMGQGERTYYPGAVPSRTRLPGGPDDEHTLPGKQMLLVGDTATRLQTWDAVRAIDYLASHPKVDPQRIASTGQSGGGTNTMLLAAVDSRLAAAAVCCGNIENFAAAEFLPPGSTDDAEQNLIGSAPLGFDRWDLLYPLAPKPLMVLSSAHDSFGTYSANYMRDGVEEYQRLAGIYRRLGHPDRIGWFDSPLPHGLSYDMRMGIYNFMLRWLQGRKEPIGQEPPVEALPESKLFATEEGSVVRALRGETPVSLARKSLSRSGTPGGVKASSPWPKWSGGKLNQWKPGGPPHVLGRMRYANADLEAIEVQSAVSVFLPAWLFLPKGNGKVRKTILLLDPAGRQGWREGEMLEQLAAKGLAVCAADVRGLGDLTPEFSPGSARYARNHASEQHYAWASLIAGEPLARQRAVDILALVGALSARPELSGGGPVRVAARGALTVPALLAAADEPRIGSLLLSDGLVSFRSLLDAEEFAGGGYFTPPEESGRDLSGTLLPGVLLDRDLPEIAASIAPRPVMLAGVRGPLGEVLTEDETRRTYSVATNVVVRAGTNRPGVWNAETLAELL